jgi:hypothetical protein
MFFEFECPEHGLFEDLVYPDMRQAPCLQCGLSSPRQLSAFRINHLEMATSGSASPESIKKFERAHRQQKAKETKSETNHGEADYGKSPGSD